MSNQSKIQKNDYFSRVEIFRGGWLRNRWLEFLNLLKMIRFRYPFQPIKVQASWLLIYGFIYPFPRIILGEKKAWKICHSFLKTLFSSTLVLPLSPLLKSKVILRDFLDFEIYHDIYVYNAYIHEALRKGMNIIDIGAHVGMYTMLAAEKVGDTGKVIAIEPEPKNYKQLLKNIELNKFKNVIPVNIALTDHEGWKKLYICPDSYSHSLLPTENKMPSIDVSVRTLDDLLEELDIKKIDIIKIDAEGVEIPILKGAEKTLKANPNIKMIVASYHYPSEVEEVCQFLNDRSFETKILEGDIIITV